MTRLLSAWQSGDTRALERLTPLIYEELRNRARRYMKRERPGHTLQATAVVHEAFVKLVEMNVSWQDRAHFFAVAARQMRRILVDHAKTRFRDKRGGTTTGSLDELDALDLGPATAGDIDVLEIDEALAAPRRQQSAARRNGRAALLRRPDLPGAVRNPEGVRSHGGSRDPPRESMDPADRSARSGVANPKRS